jgi:hypothetical protein
MIPVWPPRSLGPTDSRSYWSLPTETARSENAMRYAIDWRPSLRLLSSCEIARIVRLNNLPSSFGMGDPYGPQHVWGATATCGVCGNPVSFLAGHNGGQSGVVPMSINGNIEAHFVVGVTWPSRSDPAAPPHTPPPMRDASLRAKMGSLAEGGILPWRCIGLHWISRRREWKAFLRTPRSLGDLSGYTRTARLRRTSGRG